MFMEYTRTQMRKELILRKLKEDVYKRQGWADSDRRDVKAQPVGRPLT